MYLSLTGSEKFDRAPFMNIQNLDKLIHFCMYFGLMSVIIFENRNFLKSKTHLFLIAAIPLCYGILMELIQLTLISSRSGSILDIIFNAAGIVTSVFLWILIRQQTKKGIR
jgi:VanZ family protein